VDLGRRRQLETGNWQLTRNREKYYKSDEELKGMKKPM
jgi:hypothetical protein